jgi:putative MATE family efflux protein
VLIAAFAPQVIALFGGEGEVADKAVAATRICCIGLPFWTLMMCTSGILQGHGNAKIPMIIVTAYNFACAGIGYLLIFGGFGIPRMEVRGAAWTLVVSQILMSAVSMAVLSRHGFFKNVGEAGLTAGTARECIARVLRLGLPPAVENLLWQFGAVAMLRPILSYGDYAYAAHQLGMQAEAISYMPTMGFGIATSSLISRSQGAGNAQISGVYYRKIIKYISIVSAALMAIIFFARIPLMALLTDDREIIELGAIYLITVVIILAPFNLHGVNAGAIRGAGNGRTPMIISFIGLWLVRVPLCYISAYLIPDTSIVWIWSAMGVDIVVRFALGVVYLKRNGIPGAR